MGWAREGSPINWDAYHGMTEQMWLATYIARIYDKILQQIFRSLLVMYCYTGVLVVVSSYPYSPSNDSNSSTLRLFNFPPCLPKEDECMFLWILLKYPFLIKLILSMLMGKMSL